MRKNNLPRFLMIIIVFCIIFVACCSCSSSEKVTYYSQKDSYVSVEGIVSNIKYNDNSTALYIELSELSPALDDSCFKIVGENLQIVKNKKIDDKLKPGEQISFITAPKYFGDGYVMPIVGITVQGENLLDFEEGYKNWLDWLSE